MKRKKRLPRQELFVDNAVSHVTELDSNVLQIGHASVMASFTPASGELKVPSLDRADMDYEDSLALSFHELLHVKYSKKARLIKTEKPVTAHVYEDCRAFKEFYKELNKKGYDFRTGTSKAGYNGLIKSYKNMSDFDRKVLLNTLKTGEQILEQKGSLLPEDKLTIALQMVRQKTYSDVAWKTIEERRLFEKLFTPIEQTAIAKILKSTSPKKGLSKKACLTLESMFSVPQPKITEIEKTEKFDADKYREELEKKLAEMKKKIEMEKDLYGRPKTTFPIPTNPWDCTGEMTIIKPTLTEKRQIKKGEGKKHFNAREGFRIGNMSRFVTDQRVFHRTRYEFEPSGTFLIDVSGSMRLTQEDIEAIIAIVPQALIAMYSGSGHNGDLVILAEGRKLVKLSDVIKFKHDGNIIDLPALKWLSEQKGPRFWLCDGHVTGKGDQVYESITAECFRIMRDANITNFKDAESLRVKLGEIAREKLED